MTSRVALLLVSTLALIISPTLAQSQSTPQTCGNGQLDAGEQCDYSATSSSSSCCTPSCQFAPESTPCQNGLGTCASGQCSTRASQCNAYQSASFQFVSAVNPGNLSSVGSPWRVCHPEANTTTKVEINTEVFRESILANLIPDGAFREAQCFPSCQGVSSDGGRAVCIDFRNYPNLPATVPDYLPCFADGTAGTSVAKIKDSLKTVADDAEKNTAVVSNLVKPGVCINGVCRLDGICDSRRCSGHGKCVAAPYIQQAIRAKLGLEKGNLSTSVFGGIVQCACDAGYFGESCAFSTSAQSIGGSFGRSDKQYTKTEFDNIIMVTFASSFAGTLFLLAVAFFVFHYCITPASQRKIRENSPFIVEDGMRNNEYAAGDDATRLSKIVIPADFEGEGDIKPAPRQVDEDSTVSSFDTNLQIESGAHNADEHENESLSAAHIFSTGASSALLDAFNHNANLKDGLNDIDNKENNSNKLDTITEIPSPLATISNFTPTNKLPANYLRASHAYVARMSDELSLMPGDILYLIKSYDDGWAKAYNLRSGKEGAFPLSYTKRVTLKPDAIEGMETARNSIKSFIQSGTIPEDMVGESVSASVNGANGVDGAGSDEERSASLKNA